MKKDRDQLTRTEAEDRNKIHPKRSADREATGPLDPSTGPGPASTAADPEAVNEVPEPEKRNYRK